MRQPFDLLEHYVLAVCGFVEELHKFDRVYEFDGVEFGAEESYCIASFRSRTCKDPISPISDQNSTI